MAPSRTAPALLTRMSMRPCLAIAVAMTEEMVESGDVTSKARVVAPRVERCVSLVRVRAVAITVSPRWRARVAIVEPKPEEQPVMSQTLGEGLAVEVEVDILWCGV